MAELSLIDEPGTFAERQAAAAKTLAELAKWHHCGHVDAGDVHEFAGAVRRCIDRGHAPEFVWSDYHDAPNSYAWQLFCQTVADGIVMDREAVEQSLSDARRRLENEDGKPSASDGSKGQWKASLSSQMRTYEWLLYGDDGHRLEGAEPQRDLTDAEPATVPDDAEREGGEAVFPEVEDDA